jgi:catechol 2,3-dioxygenase-like lactoylglutathione lyase family enzyme
MIRKELDRVSLSVADFERSRPLYEGVLGLEQDSSRPDFGLPGGWFQLGTSQIHLIQCPEALDVGSTAPKMTPVARHLGDRMRDAIFGRIVGL